VWPYVAVGDGVTVKGLVEEEEEEGDELVIKS
jgi:hypothetical protein